MKYEYHIESYDYRDPDIQLMNKLGSEGWDVIKISKPRKSYGGFLYIEIFYKRVIT